MSWATFPSFTFFLCFSFRNWFKRLKYTLCSCSFRFKIKKHLLKITSLVSSLKNRQNFAHLQNRNQQFKIISIFFLILIVRRSFYRKYYFAKKSHRYEANLCGKIKVPKTNTFLQKGQSCTTLASNHLEETIARCFVIIW